MNTLFLVLASCLCTAYSSSFSKDGNQSQESFSESYSYSVSLIATKKEEVVANCSGAQIGLEWIITAAECLDITKADKISMIYAAANKPYRQKSNRLETSEYVIHPQYDPETKANNIALIRCILCGEQDEDHIVKLGTSQGENIPEPENTVITSVMNSTETENTESFYVYHKNTKILSWFWCKLSYIISVGAEHICASSKCRRHPQVDIGAPLVIEEKSKGSLRIVGVATSIAPWTTWISLPVVFTRVEPYKNWIHSVTTVALS